MKDPFERTKVVLRHLPPAFSQQALMEQIDGRFAGRYDWVCFRPGKASHKNQRYSRAYINFKMPEDVVEFAEFFDGHIFVNEKGTQYKALVEYAPSQRVPKPWSKKDGREGTISKDLEYLEFIECLSKPVEHLPSAEIQLERKEAERAAAPKEVPIVTPLMDFVRQKRAVKSGPQRSSGGGKLSRRASGVAATSSNPSSKRGSEKRKVSTSMYVLRDSTKNGNSKDKPTYILVPRREEQQLPDKILASSGGTEALEDESAASASNGTAFVAAGAVDPGKSRLVLLKGKEREGSHASGGGLAQHQNVRSSPSSSKQSPRLEASGRIIRSILSNKEGRQIHAEQQMQTGNMEKDKRPPRPNVRVNSKDQISGGSLPPPVSDGDDKRFSDDKVTVNYLHGSVSVNEKHDKRTRNKDRPDRGVWTPLRRSERSHSSDGTLSSTSESSQMFSDSFEGASISQQAASIKTGEDDMVAQIGRIGRGSNHLAGYDVPSGQVEKRSDISGISRGDEIRSHGGGGGRASLPQVENGSHRHVNRRGLARGSKEADSSLSLSEGKHSKRGSSSYGSHERQVWVQKSGSAS